MWKLLCSYTISSYWNNLKKYNNNFLYSHFKIKFGWHWIFNRRITILVNLFYLIRIYFVWAFKIFTYIYHYILKSQWHLQNIKINNCMLLYIFYTAFFVKHYDCHLKSRYAVIYDKWIIANKYYLNDNEIIYCNTSAP